LDWGYNKTHVQLIYHNKTFGDVNLFYNPMPSQGWFLDQLSDRAERFILKNYKLDTTNELLTSRIGLITLAHTTQVLDLSKTIDQHFPALGSNCTLKASTFINTLFYSY
jgi:hypothetical protein